jgi:cardiolipin synthase
MVVPDAVHGNAVAYAAFQYHYDRLLAAGVAIWEYPALVHAKALVADDEVLVGTLNLDAWALYRNPEIALHIRDAGVADTFRRDLFEVDIGVSQAGAAAIGRRARLRNAAFERMAPLL